MLRVADAVEAEALSGFHMQGWIEESPYPFHSCGTTACVAGFAFLLDTKRTSREVVNDRRIGPFNFNDIVIGTRAAEALDLEPAEARRLFYATSPTNEYLSSATIMRYKDLIPDALRWMALRGKVDWWAGLKASACLHGAEL